MHFIYFLGRFHVVVLHLPITLILIAGGFEWLTRGGRRPDLQPALRVLWPATAICAVATVILGYMHFSEGGFTGSSALAHRALGTSVGVVSILGWWLSAHRDRPVWRSIHSGAVILLVALIFATGHFGGNLSHGSDFLVAYAPNWVRRALGLQSSRPPVTDIADADPYLDVVRPIFEQRCFSCHNSAKRRGGLDLSSYATVLKGGDDGPAIVKGSAANSDMIRRVTLAPGNDDFMPKDGNTPLTSDQISILRWWIDSGAKSGVKLASLQVPADVRTLVTAELHLGGTSASASSASSAVAPEAQEIALGAAGAKANPQTVESLVKVGFMARQVSMADAHLIVSPTVPLSLFSAPQIQTLASAGSAQIVQLDLRGAALDDAAVEPLTHLTSLEQLRLDRNRITDKFIQTLAGLPHLQVLSLYGDAGITDASIPALAQIKSLRQVFLWQTGVTSAGVEKLRAERPDLMVDFGDETGAAQPTTKQTAAARTSTANH